MTSSSRASIYHRHRFPSDVIAHAVWLYFRFPLSLRMVEGLLAQRGIIVSHQTIRVWAEKFGGQSAENVRRRIAGQFDSKWHLDEDVIVIRGVKHWLWRAVDQDGFVLDVLMQSLRDTKAVRRLQRFVSVHDPIANLFHLPRHEMTSISVREMRSLAMDT